MNNKFMARIAGVAFTFAALTSATSCSMFQQNNLPHFSGEGKCPVCGTIISKHPATQQSTVDKSFLQEILNKDYSIKEYKFEEPKRMEWKDDTITETQENLVPFFKTKTVRGFNSILPVSVVVDNTINDIFLYFVDGPDNVPGALRLRLQYYADDPLNYNDMVFTVDGFDYKFHPVNIQRGHGEGVMIWENSDDELKVADKDLVYALSHCQYWTQVKLHGDDNMVHVKQITKEQLADFKRTVQLFLLRGGKFAE
ncbi:MAG: hypothetical protein KBT09_07640 [Bacteroidales bacterium]|nr:hypothetical protein [Candidatus Sodaliphilus fimicaballi]